MLTVKDIINATKGKILGTEQLGRVSGVSTDSRTVCTGELFIAIKGEKFDGNDFVNEVAKKGVKVMMVSKKITPPVNVVLIYVKDTTVALGMLARFYREQFDIPVIAITGSVGKTTTKEMIASVLATRFHILKSEKSFNNQYGVPLTILKLKKHHQILILELGTNHRGEIAALAKIAQPTMCVFTMIGESHLEGLGNALGVFREKSQMIKYMKPGGSVVYNADNEYLRRFLSDKYSFPKFSYSIDYKSDVQAIQITKNLRGISFKVKGHAFQLKEPVAHNVFNALSAIVCGRLLGMTDEEIQQGFKNFKNPDGRQNIYGIKKHTVIDDTYNANPVSYRSAIVTLDAWPATMRKILICADMLELGERRDEMHRQLGEFIAQTKIDVVITIGDGSAFLAQRVKELSRKKVYHCRSVEQIANRLKTVCGLENVILVKGSRGMKMERVVVFLKQYLKGN